MPSTILFYCFLLATLASGVYLAAALLRLSFLRLGTEEPPLRPPVTVLKPVCGLEAELEENLRSFCRQDYPVFQILFGVREESDPAIPVVRKVMAEFPEADLRLVVDGMVHGPNLKAGNLANMMETARHDILVVADSDMRVEPGYLSAVAAPFSDPRVGAVTCPYSGSPRGGLASSLGALNLTDWFLPSALVAVALQEPDFCFGATMAARREALEAIGGFSALASCLADDFQLGNRIAKAGWKVRLSPYAVENVVSEPDLRTLIGHELRWSRTVRASRPTGYAFSFVSAGGMTLSILFLLLSGFGLSGWLLTAAVFGLRLRLHYRLRALLRSPPPPAPWLLPLRDALSLGIWAAGLFGRRVHWRGRDFRLNGGGEMVEIPPPERRLVITADDFGLSLPVNEAVETAHRRGILAAADLMVAEEAAADAVERARRMPGLRVGLHLALSRGRSVLPPGAVPDLVDENGRFEENLVTAGIRYFFHPAIRRQLAREIRAQYEAFAATGLPLDHLSVHNHLQLHPTILSLALRIGREFGLKAVRVPWEPPKSFASLPFALCLFPWAALCRARIRRAGMTSNDRLYGISEAGRMDAAAVRNLLKNLPAGRNELHLHPATGTWAGRDRATAGWHPEGELAALTATEVRTSLERTGIRCGGYSDFFEERAMEKIGNLFEC